MDGTGGPARDGDVLLEEDRIVAVGDVAPNSAEKLVDCRGLVIAPGFIDSHTHSDLQVLEGRTEKLRQGVTTEVVGNCGFSAYPPAQPAEDLRAFANGIFCGDDYWGWPDTTAYLRAVEQSRTANVYSLAGHGSLRIAVAGPRQGALTVREMDLMEGLLDEAFDAGATGFSTGLMYAPGSSAPTAELERLCRLTAKRGKIYTSHIRTYFSGLVEAAEEQIKLALRTGVRLQISHLQAVGAANWPLQAVALERIEAARHEGVDVEFDCYPYVAGSSVLTQLLRKVRWTAESMQCWSCWPMRSDGSRLRKRWRRTCRGAGATSSSPPWTARRMHPRWGRTLADLATERKAAPTDVVFDLLREEHGAVNMLCFNQSEENLRASLQHGLATVISDGFYVKGRPHPRLHGTFPLLLGEMVRERRWLRLEEAVHKVTGKPAERYGMTQRGTLTVGNFADITIFDASEIGSAASYESPQIPPTGIRHVFRNGEQVVLPATTGQMVPSRRSPSRRT